VAELSGDATKMAHDTAQKAADRKNAQIRSRRDQTRRSIRTARRIRRSASDRQGRAGGGVERSDVKALRTGVQSGKTAAADLKTAGFSRAEAGALLTKGQKGSAGATRTRRCNASGRGTKQQRVLNPTTAKTSRAA
jgi:hypothetical protein